MIESNKQTQLKSTGVGGGGEIPVWEQLATEQTDTFQTDPWHTDPWQTDLWQVVSIHVQSALVISNSKEPSEILQDIRTSTYQICSIEEK